MQPGMGNQREQRDDRETRVLGGHGAWDANNESGEEASEATADQADRREHDDANEAFPQGQHRAERYPQHRNPRQEQPDPDRLRLTAFHNQRW